MNLATSLKQLLSQEIYQSLNNLQTSESDKSPRFERFSERIGWWKSEGNSRVVTQIGINGETSYDLTARFKKYDDLEWDADSYLTESNAGHFPARAVNPYFRGDVTRRFYSEDFGASFPIPSVLWRPGTLIRRSATFRVQEYCEYYFFFALEDNILTERRIRR